MTVIKKGKYKGMTKSQYKFGKKLTQTVDSLMDVKNKRIKKVRR